MRRLIHTSLRKCFHTPSSPILQKSFQFRCFSTCLYNRNNDEGNSSELEAYSFKVNKQVETYLLKMKEKHEELTKLLYAGEINKQSQHTELKWLNKLMDYYEKFENMKVQRKQLEEMIETESDKELKALAEEEYKETHEQYDTIQDALIRFLLKAPGNSSEQQIEISPNSNVIIEIRPGTGGDEAALFAMELFQMYEKFAALKGWKFEVLNLNVVCAGEGCKEGIAMISSSHRSEEDNDLGIYGTLKYESGVHRVQRVPATEGQGRVHTSSASVVIMPEIEENVIKINQSDLRIDTMRASGAGGQHVNTTDSAVRITHIPTNTVVVIADERSQHRNKEKALKVLHSRLYQQQQEEMLQKVSSERKEQIGSGDRSEKIRTYNYPQDRITDHRISYSQFGIDKMLDGEILESFAEKLYKKERMIQFNSRFIEETSTQTNNKKKK
ncbi:hypothetical protein ABK040_001198 [Willaertia magna]